MAENGQVIACHTVEAWKEQLEKGKGSTKLIVVDFTATWCGPCKIMTPVVEELAKKLPHVTFLKVDVDELESVANEWDVQSMPTFIFLKDGKLVDKFSSANKQKLESIVEKLATDTP